jgi:hypothetical protein
MHLKDNLPNWVAFDRIRPALIAGLAIFAASDVLDLVLFWLGLPAAATILNSVAIAILGALILLFYLSASYESQNYARAKERMILVAELNHHIRRALVVIEHSALLEDRMERLRNTEQAVARIDSVLTDLLPTIGSAEKPRYSLPSQN